MSVASSFPEQGVRGHAADVGHLGIDCRSDSTQPWHHFAAARSQRLSDKRTSYGLTQSATMESPAGAGHRAIVPAGVGSNFGSSAAAWPSLAL